MQTYSLKFQLTHHLVPKFSAELPQLRDWQVCQKVRHSCCHNQGLLGGFVHTRGKLSQDLAMSDPFKVDTLSASGTHLQVPSLGMESAFQGRPWWSS